MAPPRLECLNSMRTVCRKVPCLKASFSTSRSFRADGRPTPSSHFDDIDSLGSSESPAAQIPSALCRPVSETTILPRRPSTRLGEHTPKSGNVHSTQRLSKLLNDSINMKKERTRRESMTLAPRDSSSGESTTTPTTEEELKLHSLKSNLTRWITRRFKEGDVYSPHDLSWVEMSKWRRRGRPAQDAFDALDLNPLDHYRNFSMVSEYMTAMGRIKHSKDTGLRPVNQRRIARTIRRAIGMGLTPSVHRHPEILQKILAKKPITLR